MEGIGIMRTLMSNTDYSDKSEEMGFANLKIPVQPNPLQMH